MPPPRKTLLAIGAVRHIREVGWTIMMFIKYCTVVKLLSQSSVVALRGGIDLTEQHSKSANSFTITAKSHTQHCYPKVEFTIFAELVQTPSLVYLSNIQTWHEQRSCRIVYHIPTRFTTHPFSSLSCDNVVVSKLWREF